MSEQEPSLVERLRRRVRNAKEYIYPYEHTTNEGTPGYDAELDLRSADRITYLQEVVVAWRESHATNHERREAALVQLAKLNQIEPPQEGCYLKLKDPTP